MDRFNRIFHNYFSILGNSWWWFIVLIFLMYLTPFVFLYWLITEPFVAIYDAIKTHRKYHEFFKANVHIEPYYLPKDPMVDDDMDDNN